MCILLVEDEDLIRAVAAATLLDGGFVVREAENGDQASVLIAQDPAVFTLLITDIQMPGSLDGTGVARLLRAQRPTLPVIFMTGRPDLLKSLQPFGPLEVMLRKPFALPNLLATVRWLLDPGGKNHAGRSSQPYRPVLGP